MIFYAQRSIIIQFKFFQCKITYQTGLLTQKYKLSYFIVYFKKGIYVDGDIIFLKDMSILAEYNLAYRWSVHCAFNTAVLGFNNKFLTDQMDELYALILDENKETNVDQLVGDLHPTILAEKVIHRQGDDDMAIFEYEPLRIFHTALFDPIFNCLDDIVINPDSKLVCRQPEFVSRKLIEPAEFSVESFFAGAFTYHVHLSGVEEGSIIHNESYFRYFELDLESRIFG